MDEKMFSMSDTDEANKVLLENAGWKKPPSIEDLKQDITDAQSDHTAHVTKVRAWLDMLHTTGTAAPVKRKNRSSVQPKLIRKHAEWRYSALTEAFMSTPDLFNVSPKTFEDKESAIQNGLLLNYQFNNELNKVEFIDEFVRTVVDEGTLIGKVGWEFKTEKVERIVPIYEYYEAPEQLEMLEEVHMLFESNPLEYSDLPEYIKAAHEYFMENGLPVTAELVDEETIEEEKYVYNRPTIEICNVEQVIIDPSCLGDLNKAKFIVHTFPSCIADLSSDGKYSNLDKINLNSNNILGAPDSVAAETTTSFNFKDKARQKFFVSEYWGMWDIEGNNSLEPIVVTWVGDTIIRAERNPFPFKKPPFICVPYLPVKKSIYGETDAELLEDNQRIVGAVTRGMIDLMGRSANAQQGFRKDALDVTNKRKFERGEDYEFNPGVNPDQAFYAHKFPEIPNSAGMMINMQNAEAEALSGVKAFHGGLGSDALGKVATGIRGVLDAASKRELAILRRLAAGIVSIGKMFISMNQEFMDDEQVIRVTNERFVAIRREELAGKFDLKLTISTAEEDDAKAAELAFMLQTTGNTMGFGITQLILSDIARLRRMPDLAKKIEDYQPQPDPMDEYLKELEIKIKEAELEKIRSETYRNLNDASQKAAKADNIAADTDNKASDFVENISGQKHAKDLERIGEQARSQGQLKVLEHELKQDGEARRALIDAYIARMQNNPANEE